MTDRVIDPEKVAALAGDEYAAFLKGMDLVMSHCGEKDFPDEIFVITYRIANRCGARVRSFDELKIVAVQFLARKMAIERLRRF